MAVVSYVAKLSPEFSALALTALTAWFVVAAWAWPRFLVARSRVVEQTPDGKTVVAGEANELPTGEVIREDLGTPRRAAED